MKCSHRLGRSSWVKWVAVGMLAACTSVAGSLPDVAAPIQYSGSTAYDAALRVELDKVEPGEETGLHNVYRLSPNIISGSEPHGEAALAVLERMGVRTILSVDGKVPDAVTAAKYGMSYVHVPIQYKGISDDEMMRIAKTFREREAPFFVHCFHGKHRGPAAAAVGRLVLDGIPREQALAEMRQWCGTSPSYEGLYATIAQAPVPTVAESEDFDWDFPAAHQFGGFRHAMIDMARASDNLKLLAKGGWQHDPAHPDLDALNEAEILQTLFLQSTALEDTVARGADFGDWLQQSADASRELVEGIRKLRAGEPSDLADQSFAQIKQSCSACHKAYRNR